jgi:son of sevenless-like protein
MWIATLIVSETDLRRRIEVLEHCIKTCQACVELKNFNALMEIVSGIHSFAVDRLKKTFEVHLLPLALRLLHHHHHHHHHHPSSA